MMPPRQISLRAKRLLRDDSGAALVEFGLLLPTLLLFFALIIEGSRTFWSYQAAIAGVRDASRYLGRVAPVDICDGGVQIAAWTGRLTRIVRETVDGDAIFPSSISVNSVTPSLACVAGDYRQNPVPMATVTAEMSITYPFAGAFALVGVELDAVTTTITDKSRIFGS